ncbi:MAG: hypothetical protein Q4G68_01040 [Planctomycetia bacterium]|nr:hypothetical protein [Planctomycetia bacterium]
MDKRTQCTRRDFLAAGSLLLTGNIALTNTADLYGAASAVPVAEAAFKAAQFKVDVTPPVGTHLAYVMNESIEYPIYVSGLILDDGTTRIVWVSGDFIFISGETYRRWQRNIAQAAGTTPEKVFLHVVHQHDTPLVTTDYEQSEEGDEYVINKEYCLSIEKRIFDAVASAAAGPWAPIKRILTAEREIEGLASNRRLVDTNGVCVAMRFSGCTDPKMQAWPVGVIDPKLRTIAFEMTDGKIFAALHFYATHPMAAYLRMKVGPDVPGWALRKLAMKEPGTLHIYFTGCGGNITFGKYNPGGDIKAIETLGNRLANAIGANMQSLKNNSLGKIVLKTTAINIPFDLTRLKKSAENTERKNNARIWLLKTLDQWKMVPITSVSIGDNINFLSIGLSEVFVEYQLYAQSLLPGRFLAVASYANGIYEYTPTAKAFQEGGYEPGETACIVTPEIETVLKKGIADVLIR